MSQRLRLVAALLHPRDNNRFTLMYAPISASPDYALEDKDRYEYHIVEYKYDGSRDVLSKWTKTLRGNKINLFPVDSMGKEFSSSYFGSEFTYKTAARLECIGIYLENEPRGQSRFIFNVMDMYTDNLIYTFRIANLVNNNKVMIDKTFIDREEYSSNNCVLMIDTLYDSISKGKNLVGLHIRGVGFEKLNDRFMYVNLDSTIPEICYKWETSVKDCIKNKRYRVICEDLDKKAKHKYIEEFDNAIEAFRDCNRDSGIIGYDKPMVYVLIHDYVRRPQHPHYMTFIDSCLILLQNNFLTIVPGYKTLMDSGYEASFKVRRLHDHYYGISCIAYVGRNCRRFRIPMLNKKTGKLVHIEVNAHHVIGDPTCAYYQPVWFDKDFILVYVELADGFNINHCKDEKTDLYDVRSVEATHCAFMVVDYEGNIKGIWYNIDEYWTLPDSTIYKVFKMADGSYLAIYRRYGLGHDYVEYLLLNKNGRWHHFDNLEEKCQISVRQNV
jgi:hypothetical protein